MSYAKLPISLWGYALESTAYILNKILSKSVSSTPYEIWKQKKPDFKHVKVWGCPTHVKKHDPDKLESRIKKYRFVGYPKQTFGYYFYQPFEQRVFVTKRAVFLKKEYLLQEDNENKIDLEEVPDSQINDSSLDEPSIQVVQDNI